jgi:hypothetical protein
MNEAHAHTRTDGQTDGQMQGLSGILCAATAPKSRLRLASMKRACRSTARGLPSSTVSVSHGNGHSALGATQKNPSCIKRFTARSPHCSLPCTQTSSRKWFSPLQGRSPRPGRAKWSSGVLTLSCHPAGVSLPPTVLRLRGRCLGQLFQGCLLGGSLGPAKSRLRFPEN